MTHGNLEDAGYTKDGINKDSIGSNMMSHADTTNHGKDVVSSLQSAGAKGRGVTG